MRSFFTGLTALTLMAATGFLTADVVFGVSTPFSRPSLLLITSALIVFAIQLHKTRRRQFLRAIDTFVQRQSLRDMEVELQREREKSPARTVSDSQAMHKIAT